VTVSAITSLGFAQAGPARLADHLRGHWAIEMLHQLRDVTFCEDASQVRTGAGPHVIATLPNLVIGMHGRAGQPRRRPTTPRPRPHPPLATLAIPREQPRSTTTPGRWAPSGPGRVGSADLFQAQVENLPDDVLGDRLGLGEADRALGQVVAGKPALDRSDHLRAEREQAQVVLEGAKPSSGLRLYRNAGMP
jgi:hypothetical protein